MHRYVVQPQLFVIAIPPLTRRDRGAQPSPSVCIQSPQQVSVRASRFKLGDGSFLGCTHVIVIHVYLRPVFGAVWGGAILSSFVLPLQEHATWS